MLLSIFTRPLFINPQAYLIIPELASIHNYTPYDFDSTEYSFKVITSGRIEGRLLKADDNYILHLDLYSIDGNCVLGEFYLNNSQVDLNSFNLQQNDNIVTINFSSIPSPIASYRTYDKTNDDADRDVLTDLTGNGHNIQLYNFAYSESSGYGLYETDFNNWIKGPGIDRQSNKFIITTEYTGNAILYFYTDTITNDIPSFTVKITGLNFSWDYKYISETGEIENYRLYDGINELPISYVSLYTGNRTFIGFTNTKVDNIQNDVIVEQIPDYQGALVSDGIDDYGLCENFHILTKEKGYTVCMIRKIPSGTSSTAYVLSNSSAVGYDGFCDFEKNDNSTTISWGGKSSCTLPELFTYQTSSINNGNPMIKGDATGTNKLSLFTSNASHTDSANIAFYALEIYDRDLTDEEIAKVKESMIAEYESKTGNTYTEETT